MAELTLSRVKLSEYKAVFSLFDEDGNGSITEQELGTALRKLGQSPTDAEVLAMIKKADTDQNGTIELSEFVSMMENDTDSEEDVKEAFNIYDTNRNGFIEVPELQVILKNLGGQWDAFSAMNLIRKADVNGDGQIDYSEFIKIMCL